MAKANFTFNPNTGTMEMAETPRPAVRQADEKQENAVDIVRKTGHRPNISVNEGQVIFREISDRDIIQIQDQRTRKTVCVISGYALHFAFNLAELHSVDDIESCLEGLKKLFRNKIMEEMSKNISSSK